jgi:hypothetical protein
MADMYIVPGLNCCWTRRLPNKVNAVIADIMNATAEQLDNFLREADPATAQTVEQIVRGLLSLRPKAVPHRPAPEAAAAATYRLPARNLGARPGLDLTKLAHADEDE